MATLNGDNNNQNFQDYTKNFKNDLINQLRDEVLVGGDHQKLSRLLVSVTPYTSTLSPQNIEDGGAVLTSPKTNQGEEGKRDINNKSSPVPPSNNYASERKDESEASEIDEKLPTSDLSQERPSNNTQSVANGSRDVSTSNTAQPKPPTRLPPIGAKGSKVAASN